MVVLLISLMFAGALPAGASSAVTVSSITAAVSNGGTTSSTSIAFSVDFSSSVTGVSSGAFDVSGTSDPSVASVSGSGADYTVTVDASQVGTLNFSVPATTSILDGSGGTLSPGSSTYSITIVSSVTVSSKAQTIVFESHPVSGTAGGGFTVAARASSGLTPIVFSIESSKGSRVCALNSKQNLTDRSESVDFLGVGTCVIEARQAGDSQYAPASATLRVPVERGSQRFEFITHPGVGHVGGTYVPMASVGEAGNRATFSIADVSALVCSSAKGVVHFEAIGTCLIRAQEAGNSNFSPAPVQTQMVKVLAAGRS